jgi:molecular chaperone GrpE
MSEEFAEQTEDVTSENVGSAGAIEPDQKAESAEFQSDEEKIASLEAQLLERNDQYLRKAADFENFRKRLNREKQEAIDFANQMLLLDLIPIIDDFERAIKAAEIVLSKTAPDAVPGKKETKKEETASQDFMNLYEGLSMTEKRLLTQLENKWGLKRFDSAGEIFDPNRHEAIMMDKSDDVTEPTVQEDFIKGYTLKDRVIRSAKVKVLMPNVSATQTDTADSANLRSEETKNSGTEKTGSKDTE